MLNVCEDFAKDYNILFNASKSKLMYFGKNNLNCENQLCMSNGSSIAFVEQCVHLGTKIYSDISKKNIDNATNDLYMRTNNLMADFSYAQSSTLSVVYNAYCMNVYGSQLWCFNDYKSVERFYIAWRKTIRRIWRLDKRTHNVLINLINRCLPINLILEKRCVKYDSRTNPPWTKHPGQHPPDNTPLDKTPRWTKPPRGQNPPGQNPPGQNPPDKTPPDKTPPDKPPPDKTPRTKPPRTKPPPDKTTPDKTPPDKTPRTKPPTLIKPIKKHPKHKPPRQNHPE